MTPVMMSTSDGFTNCRSFVSTIKAPRDKFKVNSNAFMSFTIFSFSTLRVVGFGKPRNIADKLNDPTIFFDHKVFVLVSFSSSEVAE